MSRKSKSKYYCSKCDKITPNILGKYTQQSDGSVVFEIKCLICGKKK